MNANECKKLDKAFNDGDMFKYLGYTYDGNKVKTRGGRVTIITERFNNVAGINVQLTSMTAKSGTIVYAVIVRHLGKRRGLRWGRGYKQIYKYTTMGNAYAQYKKAIA